MRVSVQNLLISIIGLLLALTSFSAAAIPALQLDIIGGTYDTETETIVTSNNEFDLVAYGNENSPQFPGTVEDYFIGISLVPKTGAVDFGSFDFGPDTYTMANFTEGTIPGIGHTGSIFPTFYTEVMFNFNPADKRDGVDTQLVTGSDPASNPPENDGKDLFYVIFAVDISNLSEDFELHFDLYNKEAVTERVCTGQGRNRVCNDVLVGYEVDKFAPFSHDAETTSEIPEPAPLALLGIGMILLALSSVRRKKLLNSRI